MYILDIFRDYKKNLLFQFFINIQKLHAECAAIKKYYCLKCYNYNSWLQNFKKICVYLAVFEFLLKREHKFWNIKNNYSNVYVINEK